MATIHHHPHKAQPANDPAPSRTFVPSPPQARRLGELAALPNVARFEAANLANAAAWSAGTFAPICINGVYYVQGAA